MRYMITALIGGKKFFTIFNRDNPFVQNAVIDETTSHSTKRASWQVAGDFLRGTDGQTGYLGLTSRKI